jgi:hypothetical protein
MKNSVIVGGIVRGNHVHDTYRCAAVWDDIDSTNMLYEDNYVHDNDGPGIFHEIGWDAVIRRNLLVRNGRLDWGWVWNGGIQVAESPNTEVYANHLFSNRHGVIGVQQVRSNDNSRHGPHFIQNLYVHHNAISQDLGDAAGVAKDYEYDDLAIFTSARNVFDSNTYALGPVWPNGAFAWMNATPDTNGWRAYGNDPRSVFLTTP